MATVDIDMTIGILGVSSIDINKIKEDNIKNNPDFFALTKGNTLAKYK